MEFCRQACRRFSIPFLLLCVAAICREDRTHMRGRLQREARTHSIRWISFPAPFQAGTANKFVTTRSPQTPHGYHVFLIFPRGRYDRSKARRRCGTKKKEETLRPWMASPN
uniref:Uncharacterized protein n=1 Tax=Anopheles albimanus TaxID=7167 RepID=A0A182F5J7_ANOAL